MVIQWVRIVKSKGLGRKFSKARQEEMVKDQRVLGAVSLARVLSFLESTKNVV